MTTTDVTRAWTQLARKLADELTASGDLRDPAWHAAVATTPRHVLAPAVYDQLSDQTRADQPTTINDEAGLEQVYSTTTLVTAIERNAFGAVVPVSSSTKPDLMIRMLEVLDIQDGHRVLEIGTGTGYNAALLSHRLGDDNVFSIDVDPDLIATARARLASIGRNPNLITGDGIDGLPEHAPYDRIIATCGVRQIPWAWHGQLTPGGVVLVDFKPTGAGNLVVLRRLADRLEGYFTSGYGAFMLMRHLNGDTPSGPAWQPELPLQRQRRTTTPIELPAVVWFLRSLMSSAGLRRGVLLDEQTHQPTAMTLTAADGSQCAVDLHSRTDGHRMVHEGGPTQIWAEVERSHQLWLEYGRPGWNRIGVTVAADRHTVWIDNPDSEHHWPLPTAKHPSKLPGPALGAHACRLANQHSARTH